MKGLASVMQNSTCPISSKLSDTSNRNSCTKLQRLPCLALKLSKRNICKTWTWTLHVWREECRDLAEGTARWRAGDCSAVLISPCESMPIALSSPRLSQPQEPLGSAAQALSISKVGSARRIQRDINTSMASLENDQWARLDLLNLIYHKCSIWFIDSIWILTF